MALNPFVQGLGYDSIFAVPKNQDSIHHYAFIGN